MRNTAGSIRRSAVGTSDTWVAPTPSTSTGSNDGSTVSDVPMTIARVTTLSPPTWDSGRQASQWSSWVTSSRAHVATADARTASWVSTTPFGTPVEPLVATTRASPGSTGAPSSRRVVPWWSTTTPAAIAASSAALAPWGRRWSTGKAASPASHTSRSTSTNGVPPGRSTATRRPLTDAPARRAVGCCPSTTIASMMADRWIGPHRQTAPGRRRRPTRGTSEPGRERCRRRSCPSPSAPGVRSGQGR